MAHCYQLLFFEVDPTIGSVCGHVVCGFLRFEKPSGLLSGFIKYHCWVSQSWLLVFHELGKWHSFANVALFKSLHLKQLFLVKIFFF